MTNYTFWCCLLRNVCAYEMNYNPIRNRRGILAYGYTFLVECHNASYGALTRRHKNQVEWILYCYLIIEIKLTTPLHSYKFDPNPQYPPDSTHNDTPANNTSTDRNFQARSLRHSLINFVRFPICERCCGDASIGSEWIKIACKTHEINNQKLC